MQSFITKQFMLVLFQNAYNPRMPYAYNTGPNMMYTQQFNPAAQGQQQGGECPGVAFTAQV